MGDMRAAATMRKNLTDMLLGVKLKANLPILFRIIEYLPTWLSNYLTPPGAKNMMDLRHVSTLYKVHDDSLIW